MRILLVLALFGLAGARAEDKPAKNVETKDAPAKSVKVPFKLMPTGHFLVDHGYRRRAGDVLLVEEAAADQ